RRNSLARALTFGVDAISSLRNALRRFLYSLRQVSGGTSFMADAFLCLVAFAQFFRLPTGGCSSQCSLTGHLNSGVDGFLETVRVVGRALVSIAEVHAIIARAHLTQGEPEMACD